MCICAGDRETHTFRYICAFKTTLPVIFSMQIARFFICIFFLTSLFSCRGGGGATGDTFSGAYGHPDIKNLSREIAEQPQNAALLFKRAQALRKLKEDSLALIDLNKAIVIDTSKAAYFSAIGELLFDHKDIDGSRIWFKKAIQRDPNDPTAHLKLAKLLLFIDENNEAFKEINIVLRQNPYQAEAYFLKGMAYKNLRDSNRALSSFQTAVQVDPVYQPALFQLARLYESRNDTLGLQYYENAYRADTSDVTPLHGKALFYQNLGHLAEAKATYRRCMKNHVSYTDAAFNLGWILMHQDSFELAADIYDTVLKYNSTNAEASYNKAVCLELSKKTSEALNYYRKAAELRSNYKEAQDAIKRLEK